MTEFAPEELGGVENEAIEELGNAFFAAGNSELLDADIDEDDPIEPLDI